MELRLHLSDTIPFSRRKFARIVAGTPMSLYSPLVVLMSSVVSRSAMYNVLIFGIAFKRMPVFVLDEMEETQITGDLRRRV